MADFLNVYALVILMLVASITTSVSGNLNANYYSKICPNALPTIQRVVDEAVAKERRMGASLLRLHFHDCFVDGCDASILLDNAPNIVSEKGAFSNNNSARGFNVIDQIKLAVDRACGRPVVSCADILALAARDSVVALGGPWWDVPLGRRDSRTANIFGAHSNLPSPFFDIDGLITNFRDQGLDVNDLVVLSGAHTIGFSQCKNFKNRIYSNDTSTIDPTFARNRQTTCPRNGGDTRLTPFDATGTTFDTDYFTELTKKRGLLHSDQALFVNGASTRELVLKYSVNKALFFSDFGVSMIKLGNLKPLTGRQGEVRRNCRKVNSR